MSTNIEEQEIPNAGPSAMTPENFLAMFQKMVEVTSSNVIQSTVGNLRSTPTGSGTSGDMQVCLQSFDPEVDNADDWFVEIEEAQRRFGWNEWETVVRSAHHLQGNARIWYNSWRPKANERVWNRMKADLSRAFPRKRNNGVLLDEAVNFNSDRSESYDEYARQKLSKLNKVRVEWPENVLVEVIIHGITDLNVRTSVYNQNCLDVSHLISTLSSYDKRRTSNNGESTQRIQRERHLKRRSDLSASLSNQHRPKVCFGCGKSGHIKRDCLARDSKVNIAEHVDKKPKITLTCKYCKNEGHVEENCWAKMRAMKSNTDKRVNFCRSDRNKRLLTVVVDNIPIDCLPDTGSDCSLITERVVKQLNCNRQPVCLNLSGIGNGQCISTSLVTLLLEFETLSCEVDCYVVPNHVIDVDLIIGNDVFTRPGIVLTSNEKGISIHNDCVINKFTSVRAVTKTDVLADIVTDVCGNDREYLLELLGEFRNIISRGYCVSTVNTGSLEIRLINDSIVRYQPYRLSLCEREKVRSIVEELLSNGIIRESQSPFASPVLLVKKKNGSDRMCVDFRALNRITVKDRYPLPLIDDQIDRLGNGKLFTCLDMASGFLQIPIHECSIEKTAFVTPDGQYEYLRMPFGLANAPSVFQRAINKALRPLINEGIALVYLDDVLIPSVSVKEGLEHLRKVLMALKTAGFSLNIDKCTFLMKSVEYLGREISSEGIRPGKSKVEALLKSPIPKNVREVRQFMGLATYFRKFIPSFSSKMACITKLTKIGVPWEWTSEQETARQYVMSTLTERPVLSIFNPDLPTELHTDASALGYGAILFQTKDNKRCVIGYFSKRTCNAESRYHSYELETLAIVKALKFFRVYLLGIRFILVTDCNAVKATEKKKDLVPRVARWWIYMQDFTFDIQYRKGCLISHVDYLSRNHCTVNVITNREPWIAVQQHNNPEVAELIKKFNDGSLDRNRYTIEKDMLYHLDYFDGIPIKQWYVPKGSRLGLLRIFHDEQCHIGYDKTVASITKYFWFPGLRKFVRKYLQHCIGCLTLKRSYVAPRGMLHPIPKVLKPFHTIHVDYLGPLPVTKDKKQYILVIVDAYSKFTLLYPLVSTSGAEFRESFKNFISLFGTPTRLIADSGPAFVDAITKQMLRTWQIELHIITPHVHRANGQVERYMRTIANMLRVETKIESEWTKRLWKIQLVLNSTMQRTTKTSPLQLLLDCDGTVPVVRTLLNAMAINNLPTSQRPLLRKKIKEVADEGIEANYENQKKYFNKNRKPVCNFSVGDLVILNRTALVRKLQSGVRGPFRIVNVLPNDRLQIQELVGKFTTKCAADQVRIWPREWTPDDCADMMDSESESGKQYFVFVSVYDLRHMR